MFVERGSIFRLIRTKLRRREIQSDWVLTVDLCTIAVLGRDRAAYSGEKNVPVSFCIFNPMNRRVRTQNHEVIGARGHPSLPFGNGGQHLHPRVPLHRWLQPLELRAPALKGPKGR
jgi:hypothetical protein